MNTRKEYRHKHYLANKEKSYKQSREWIKNNPERYKEIRKLWARKYRSEKKLLVINHYGGECACCGEEDIRFLCVDHIKGAGNKHRKVLRRSDMPIYLYENDFPKGFQILCFNCNMGKSIYGQCPHKIK